MGAHPRLADRVAASPAHPSSLAEQRFAVKSPEVGARCVNHARRDLCGGCSAMSIPTATIGRQPSYANGNVDPKRTYEPSNSVQYRTLNDLRGLKERRSFPVISTRAASNDTAISVPFGRQ